MISFGIKDMTLLFDTHCHLDHTQFNADRAEMIQRALNSNVKHMMTIGCDLESSKHAISIASVHEGIFASAGIHPHEASLAPEHFEIELETLLKHPKCLAVGECGLDYYYEHSQREDQKIVFEKHIVLNQKYKKPLVIHVRDAWDDLLDILRKNPPHSGILHCFTGTREQAFSCLDLGLYLSFPGIITFQNALELREVAKIVPLDRILIETDSPFLAPIPQRGKRNEPQFVLHVAEKMAELRGLKLDEFIEHTTQNAFKCLGLENIEYL
jgi:TatD DNase family protein